MRTTIIAPSVLAADFADFAGAVKTIEEAGADWVHLDVMDGHFVPNLTFGAQIVRDLRKRSAAFFDVHLMVTNPELHIPLFVEAGADCITFHLEAAVHAHKLLSSIKEAGRKAGISIVPSTPAAALTELLPLCDLALVMTVNPGFGGQALIPRCLAKVTEIVRMREAGAHDFRISVDGGISEATAPAARKSGADTLVMGSAFFAAPDRAALVRRLKNA